jgi:hypothetical protein
MKKRSGFVSNSSSSSFTCDFCGETESGMDFGLDDAGMVECVNGHTLCEDHLLGREKVWTSEECRDALVEYWKGRLAWWKRNRDSRYAQDGIKTAEKIISLLLGLVTEDELFEFFENGEGEEMWSDYEYELAEDSSRCPLCQFHEMTDSDLAKFALQELGWSREFAISTAAEAFSTYEKFKENIK